jgi:hypothetical protein
VLSAFMTPVALHSPSTSPRGGALTLSPKGAAMGALRRAVLRSVDDIPTADEIAKWWVVLLTQATHGGSALYPKAARFPGRSGDVLAAFVRLFPDDGRFGEATAEHVWRRARFYWSHSQAQRAA